MEVEIVISAFTDNLALCLRIKLEASLLQRGRGLRKMNTNVLEDATNRSHIQQERTRWRLQEIPGHGYVLGEIF